MTALYIDPELQGLLEHAPIRPQLSHATLQQLRASTDLRDFEHHFPQALPAICHDIDGPAGVLQIYEYRPSQAPDTTAALLWMHGGGYVMGHGNDAWFGALFSELAGVRVFSVNYRLAPEHPFPAALNDSQCALQWLVEHSANFGIDTARIAIGGASAGAGLAAALALHNRDIAGPSIAFQLLLYPMLDHLHDNPAAFTDVPRWPRATSLQAWEMYLGGTAASPHSVPAMATDLAGLPPAYLCIGEADIFLDEVCTYAKRLQVAGITQKCQTYPGMFHAGESLGYGTSIGRQMSHDYANALADALLT